MKRIENIEASTVKRADRHTGTGRRIPLIDLSVMEEGPQNPPSGLPDSLVNPNLHGVSRSLRKLSPNHHNH